MIRTVPHRVRAVQVFSGQAMDLKCTENVHDSRAGGVVTNSETRPTHRRLPTPKIWVVKELQLEKSLKPAASGGHSFRIAGIYAKIRSICGRRAWHESW